MARKKENPKGNWLGFFSHYLSDEEKAGIRALVDSKKRPEISAIIGEVVGNCYKLSLSANEQADTFVASITGKVGSENRGYTLSISHVESDIAITALWYVAGEVYQWGKWPIDENTAPDW